MLRHCSLATSCYIRLVRNLLNRWARNTRYWLARRSRPLRRVGWLQGTFLTEASSRQSCNYFLYVPSGLTATDTVPLLVMLHGGSSGRREFRGLRRIRARVGHTR